MTFAAIPCFAGLSLPSSVSKRSTLSLSGSGRGPPADASGSKPHDAQRAELVASVAPHLLQNLSGMVTTIPIRLRERKGFRPAQRFKPTLRVRDLLEGFPVVIPMHKLSRP